MPLDPQSPAILADPRPLLTLSDPGVTHVSRNFRLKTRLKTQQAAPLPKRLRVPSYRLGPAPTRQGLGPKHLRFAETRFARKGKHEQ